MSSAISPLAVPVAPAPVDPKLAKVAKQFEALFVRQMLSAAHKANFGESLFASQASDTFRDMQDQKFADLAANKGGFGMARMIERQLAGLPQPKGALAAPVLRAPAPIAPSPLASSKTGG